MERLFILFIVSLVTFNDVNACTCSTIPLQNLFCNSHFVIKLEITSINYHNLSSSTGPETIVPSIEKEVYYGFEILQTYRATEEAKKAFETKYIVSYPICGARLTYGLYILGGDADRGQLIFNRCGLNIHDPDEMEAQETNLLENFPKNCTPA